MKLRKVESSCEENTLISRGLNVVPTSPVTSTSSKFYKNLKKIKRTHGAENPTKNYYLAFPALSSKKTTTTITSGGSKTSSPSGVGDTKKDSNLQLLCWSNLMSSAKDSHATSSSSAQDAENFRNTVKKKTPRRQRRYGRHQSKRFSGRSDVQCNAKSYDVYDGETISLKSKNDSKKHQRNQYSKFQLRQQYSMTIDCNTFSFSAVTSKNQNVHDVAPKVDFQPGSIWDMDFKGQWEMDRDLISEFIQQQQHHKINIESRPVEVSSANQVEQSMDDADDDDVMLMSFLPVKLMDDETGVLADSRRLLKLKEAQSISSLKSKFDANVKALWNDVDDPLTKPLSHKSFDDGNACLVSSFTSENNSLGLFNFNGHQPHEVVAPSTNLQVYASDFSSIDYDYNNNGAFSRSHLSMSTVGSPGAEKFIRSGTNLQTSIWSDGEFACEPESLISKDVSIRKYHTNIHVDTLVHRTAINASRSR